MDKDIKKDIEFCEAANDDSRRDPLVEKAISRSKPIQDYVANVKLFRNMTPEEFFTAPAFSGYAAEIRTMRESYDKLTEAEAVKESTDNALADEVAELKAAIKSLTESSEAKATDDTTAPGTIVPVTDPVVVTNEDDSNKEPEIED